MARIAGIPLVELFDITDTVKAVLPHSVGDFRERFVVGHEASSSDAAIFHTGALQATATAIDEIPTEFNIGIGRLNLPLVNTGISFQLAFKGSAGTGNLESSADVWRLDLSIEVFNLIVDFLLPAIYVSETGTTPRHEVRITGSAVLRKQHENLSKGCVCCDCGPGSTPLNMLANTPFVNWSQPKSHCSKPKTRHAVDG